MNIINYKSGTYKQQYQCKIFSPVKINETITWDNPKINIMLEYATHSPVAITILKSI